MSTLLAVAFQSLRYRFGGVLLTVLAVAVSVFVLLGVEHVRREARDGFSSTVAGVDLIVGARTGEINLLLLSVFRIGAATANVSWPTVEAIAARDGVAWTVPLSLGDSHRGFRVVGTTPAFFDRYRYGPQRALTLRAGRRFEATPEVVLGSRVAKALGYRVDDRLILSHGLGATSFLHHDELPFAVVGILAATGTPVDNALYIDLDAVSALHGDDVHDSGAEHTDGEHESPSVTAVLVGLDAPVMALGLQRWVNEYTDEALLAILPGVALARLWELMASVEVTLRGISLLVLVASLLGLNAMLLASMRERRHEIDVLRTIGAPSTFILGLLVLEALLIVSVAILLAIGALFAAIAVVNGALSEQLGMTLSWGLFGPASLTALALIYATTTLLAMVPAWRAYRLSRIVGGS